MLMHAKLMNVKRTYIRRSFTVLITKLFFFYQQFHTKHLNSHNIVMMIVCHIK